MTLHEEKKHKPNLAIAKAAQRGLDLHNAFHRGGTEVGVERAHQLINRELLSDEIINKMFQYFRRHEVDKKAKDFGNEEKPSAGYIAWLLWGGDAAYEWVEKILDK